MWAAEPDTAALLARLWPIPGCRRAAGRSLTAFPRSSRPRASIANQANRGRGDAQRRLDRGEKDGCDAAEE